MWLEKVDFEWSLEPDRLVGPHLVMEAEEGLHLFCQFPGLVYLQSVEVLVFERLVEAPHHAVGSHVDGLSSLEAGDLSSAIGGFHGYGCRCRWKDDPSAPIENGPHFTKKVGFSAQSPMSLAEGEVRDRTLAIDLLLRGDIRPY